MQHARAAARAVCARLSGGVPPPRPVYVAFTTHVQAELWLGTPDLSVLQDSPDGSITVDCVYGVEKEYAVLVCVRCVWRDGVVTEDTEHYVAAPPPPAARLERAARRALEIMPRDARGVAYATLCETSPPGVFVPEPEMATVFELSPDDELYEAVRATEPKTHGIVWLECPVTGWGRWDVYERDITGQPAAEQPPARVTGTLETSVE